MSVSKRVRLKWALLMALPISSLMFFLQSNSFVYFDDSRMIVVRSFKIFLFSLFESPMYVVVEAFLYFFVTVIAVYLLGYFIRLYKKQIT